MNGNELSNILLPFQYAQEPYVMYIWQLTPIHLNTLHFEPDVLQDCYLIEERFCCNILHKIYQGI